jgi:hypothetical protein
MNAHDFLNRVAKLHDNMGTDLVNLGGYLICAPGCGERQSITAKQISRYLRKGWPKHCGHTMQWVTARQAVAEHRAPSGGGETA